MIKRTAIFIAFFFILAFIKLKIDEKIEFYQIVVFNSDNLFPYSIFVFFVVFSVGFMFGTNHQKDLFLKALRGAHEEIYSINKFIFLPISLFKKNYNSQENDILIVIPPLKTKEGFHYSFPERAIILPTWVSKLIRAKFEHEIIITVTDPFKIFIFMAIIVFVAFLIKGQYMPLEFKYLGKIYIYIIIDAVLLSACFLLGVKLGEEIFKRKFTFLWGYETYNTYKILIDKIYIAKGSWHSGPKAYYLHPIIPGSLILASNSISHQYSLEFLKDIYDKVTKTIDLKEGLNDLNLKNNNPVNVHKIFTINEDIKQKEEKTSQKETVTKGLKHQATFVKNQTKAKAQQEKKWGMTQPIMTKINDVRVREACTPEKEIFTSINNKQPSATSQKILSNKSEDIDKIRSKILELRNKGASLGQIEEERDAILKKFPKNNEPEMYEWVKRAFDSLLSEMLKKVKH